MLFRRPFRFRALTTVAIASTLLLPFPTRADKATDDLNLGVQFYKREHWKLATETLQRFLNDYPEHPHVPLATLYLGLSHSTQMQFDRARRQFYAFLRMAPNSPYAASARFRVGECSYYLNDFQEAADQLAEYVRLHPDDKLIEWGRLQLGESWIELGEWSRGEKLLQSLAETSAVDEIRSRAKYTQAMSLKKQNRPDEAVAAFRRVSRLQDQRLAARALAQAGTIRFDQKHYDRATTLYDEIVSRFPESPLAPAAVLNSGLALYRAGKYDDAVQRFEQVPADFRRSAEAKLLAGISLAELGRTDEARSSLEAVFAAAAEPRLAAEALFEQAKLELLVGRKDLAARIFVDLADRWPEDPHVVDALFNAANLRLDLADTAETARLLNRLRSDFQQESSEPRFRVLAGRLLLAQKKTDAAEEQLQAVFQGSQSDRRSAALSRYYLIRISHSAGNFAAALSHIDNLVPELQSESNADLRGAFVLGAMSALELDQFERADELATRYLTILNDGPLATDALAARTVARASRTRFSEALSDAELLIERAPENPHTWTAVIQSAELAWENESYEAARDLFQQAEHPDAPDTIRSSGTLGMAWCLFQLERFREAATVFQRVAAQATDSESQMEARFMLVRSHHRGGDLESATQEYIRVSADFFQQAAQTEDEGLRNRIRAWGLDAGRTAAQLLEEQNRISGAAQQWSALADRFADSPELEEILSDWAWMHMGAEQFDEADSVFRRLLEERPNSRFAGISRLSLAESNIIANRLEDAERGFRTVADHPDYHDSEKARALFHLVEIQIMQQDWDGVITLADRFAEEHSSSDLAPRVQLHHADALLNRMPETVARQKEQLDQSRRILDMLRRAVLEGHQTGEIWTERIWVLLGEVALELKNYGEIDRLVQEFESHFASPRQLFEIRHLQGRRWKNQPEPDFAKAREHLELVVYNNAARGSRTAASAQFLIAETYVFQKNLKRAVQEFFKVHMYHRYPDLQAPALRQAAACLKELGDPEEARLTLRSLLKEFPDSEAARELKSLRQNGS